MAAGTVCHQKHIRSAVDFAAALRNAVIGMTLFSLAGCAMGGVSIDKAVPDSTTITGSVQQPTVPDSSTLSDQSTVKNVVSALNFTQWGKKPVPWTNPDTGSQGTITTVAESNKNDQLCREFETSREAFDGVSIYRGETCMQRGGQWTVTAFAPI
ncbi:MULTISPECIES: RT0821/Lpp0805 family surface protein [Brucella/Ochrobactrum group]|uniref:Common-antigen n=3 Tax=Ochrobactrum TaxID=528 RepID=A0A2P9HKJ3_9HYPH|nr:Common-antigen [[Ochrobactrum] soli]